MMFKLTELVIAVIFLAPLFAGVVSAFIGASQRKKLLIALLVLLIFATVGLLLLGETKINTALYFLNHEITFSISITAVLIFIISLLVLLGMVFVYIDVEKRLLTAFRSSLLMFSLSFGFIAFISGQFMIRYIALDIVGLIAALIVIKSLKDKKGFRSFSIIFAVLRFGDLCLLASILLLYYHAGTLDISQMITTAKSLPIDIQSWIFGGFFIAVLIKTAAAPFGLWMRHARHGTGDYLFWISYILMPALGYYLFYRIQPIIVSNRDFTSFIVILSTGLIFLVILLDLIYRRQNYRFTVTSSVFGFFLLVATAFGPKEQLKFFIVGILIFRFLLYLREESESRQLEIIAVFVPLAINSLFIGVNNRSLPPLLIIGWSVFSILFLSWDIWNIRKNYLQTEKAITEQYASPRDSYIGGFIQQTAKWLNQNLEIRLFRDGIYGLSEKFLKLIFWINKKVEIGVFTEGFYRLSSGVAGAADWLSDKVEQGLEGLWSWLGDILVSISEGTLFALEIGSAQKSEEMIDNALNALDKHEKNVRKKNLRLDLAWIPIFLIIILVLILVV